MGGLEQGFELNDDTEWVGYLGCLEWWDNHFEMGSCFGLGVAERTYTVRQHSECGLEQGFEVTDDTEWVGWLGRHNLVKHSFWDGFVLLGGESLRGDGLCAARTKQSLGCGRPSEASRDPRVWKATLWIPCGYHVDTLWDTMWSTMWSTLWGTLWRPRNPRGYPQNPWILERDSRETQDSLKTVSRQSPQLPKHGSQRVRWDRNHLTGIAAAAATRSERGRPFSPTQECEQGEPFDVEGHRREGWDIQRHVIPHVTWHAKHGNLHGIKWVTMKSWSHHTITPLRAALRGLQNHPPLLF